MKLSEYDKVIGVMIWAPPVALYEKGLTLAGRQQAGRRSRAGGSVDRHVAGCAPCTTAKYTSRAKTVCQCARPQPGAEQNNRYLQNVYLGFLISVTLGQVIFVTSPL